MNSLLLLTIVLGSTTCYAAMIIKPLMQHFYNSTRAFPNSIECGQQKGLQGSFYGYLRYNTTGDELCYDASTGKFRILGTSYTQDNLTLASSDGFPPWLITVSTRNDAFTDVLFAYERKLRVFENQQYSKCTNDCFKQPKTTWSFVFAPEQCTIEAKDCNFRFPCIVVLCGAQQTVWAKSVTGYYGVVERTTVY